MNGSSSGLKSQLLRSAIAIVLGLWVVAAAGAAVRQIRGALTAFPRRIAQGTAAADREIRGRPFMNAIDAIRASIPKNGDYLLIEGRDNIADAHVVRAYLAPRKAELLDATSSLDPYSRAHLWEVQPPRHFIVTWTPSSIPVAGSTKDLSSLAGAYPWTHESPSLLGGIDNLPENVTVQGTLHVRGWARIPGEDLEVSLEIDGTAREAMSVGSFPRPDVCAVLPQMGDCSTCGFELVLEPRPDDAGPHELVLVFHAADGRIRHYPRVRFEWRP